MKKFQVTNLTIPNKSSLMNYALKSVPGLLMLGIAMDARMAPELQPEGPDQKSAPTTLISMKN